jgi:molybdenum cofactor cytidylyltransferase
MGTIKPLVPVGGTPMLSRVLSTIRDSQVVETIVVLGNSAEVIRERVEFGDAKVVVNASYREGMASSLQAGLAHVTCAAALIILADQPFVKSQTIDLLIDEYRRNSPKIIVPTYNRFRGNPVLLDRSVFDELSQLTGDIGCRAIFGHHTDGILKVAVQDAGVLIDLDRATDVQRFEHSGAGPSTSDLFENANLSDREFARPQIVLVGEDPVAKALVDLGRLLAFDVILIDPFARLDDASGVKVLRVLDLSRVATSPEIFVIVTSRGRFDEDAIEQALNMDAAYVALLASKKRAQEILSNLQRKGFSEERLRKLRAPAGLDIGAVTPAEIALSVMAEVVSKRRQN